MKRRLDLKTDLKNESFDGEVKSRPVCFEVYHDYFLPVAYREK